jgi:hypothetical protein
MKTLYHPPYLQDLAPADFFLLLKVKSELAGLSLTQTSFQKSWDGVIWNITQVKFTATFRQWMQHSKKCIQMEGNYVKNTIKYIIL